MILTSKEEAEYLKKKIPDVRITQTCQHKNNGKSRGKYYAEETLAVISTLKNIR